MTTKSEPEQGPCHLQSLRSLSAAMQELPKRTPCDHIHQKSTENALNDPISRTEHVCTEEDVIATNHIPCTANSTGQNENDHIECDSSHSQTGSTDGRVCILCDEPATVRLLPCGHEIICLMCSKRAKKCLQCKVYYRFAACLIMSYFLSFRLQGIVTARVNLSAL